VVNSVSEKAERSARDGGNVAAPPLASLQCAAFSPRAAQAAGGWGLTAAGGQLFGKN